MSNFNQINENPQEVIEEKRKTDWVARQKEKQENLQCQTEQIKNMSEEELMQESIKKITADTEKLTRRSMKEYVAEYIQTLCLSDMEFAKMVLNPQKNMVDCFQYINQKAYEYIQDDLKANNIKLGTGAQGYGSDIPDDLCYQWAEEYFRNLIAKEDEEEEEKFVPKSYIPQNGKSAKKKENPKKVEKETLEKEKKLEDAELVEQLSLMNFVNQ